MTNPTFISYKFSLLKIFSPNSQKCTAQLYDRALFCEIYLCFKWIRGWLVGLRACWPCLREQQQWVTEKSNISEPQKEHNFRALERVRDCWSSNCVGVGVLVGGGLCSVWCVHLSGGAVLCFFQNCRWPPK